MSTPAHTRTGLDFIEEFATIAEWLSVTVASVDLRGPVPTCPGWSSYDLVVHLGNVHAWAATIVETGQPAPEQYDQPVSRRPRVVADWYTGKAEDLYEVLRASSPDAPCWNFAFGEGRASFWPRRQVHETTIHGVDLALAVHRVPDISGAVATDGVDEVLRVFLHRLHERGHRAALSAPMCLRTTDTERAWTVRPVEGGEPLVRDGLMPGADLVEGPAAAVYTMLWKRVPWRDPSLVLTGDRRRIEAFLASRLTP